MYVQQVDNNRKSLTQFIFVTSTLLNLFQLTLNKRERKLDSDLQNIFQVRNVNRLRDLFMLLFATKLVSDPKFMRRSINLVFHGIYFHLRAFKTDIYWKQTFYISPLTKICLRYLIISGLLIFLLIISPLNLF